MNLLKVKTVVVEKVPEDVASRYKAACAIESTSMRADLIAYMEAVGGDGEGLAVLISNLADYGLGMVAGAESEEKTSAWLRLVEAANALTEAYGYTEPVMGEEPQA